MKPHFDKIEFYITNVCNLTCDECNRFNDYYFKGWQNWDDYADIYQEWAQRISIERVVILGGEPLLNPSIVKWVTNLSKLFKTPAQILSNGTRINKVAGLYDALRTNGCWMGISWHDRSTIDEFEAEVNQFLKGKVRKYYRHELQNSPFNADILWIDEKGTNIPLWFQDTFTRSAVHKNSQGKLTVFDNNPIDAHKFCGMAMYKCYHFIKGKLYKCGPVALLPEFDQQFNLDISESDRQLMNSYQPLTLENFDSHHQEFISKLDDPIPQCKFCPTGHAAFKITSTVKKNSDLL